MNYFLRLYVESNSNDLAQKEAYELVNKLNNFSQSKLFQVKQYWKINEYFEVSIDIQSELSFDEFSNKLASKWENCGASYIWNYEQEYFFTSLHARWAFLECIE